MKTQGVRPCDSCPFAPTSMVLTEGRVEQLLDLIESDGHFYCHKTVDYDVEGDEEPRTKDSSLCAGFEILRIRESGDASQVGRIAIRIGMLDPAIYDIADNDPDVGFQCAEDMRIHHSEKG